MKMHVLFSTACVAGFLTLSGIANAGDHGADAIAAAMAAPDRPEKETERDAARQPEKVLAFSQIKHGDRVADLGAGGGYFTRLISGVVGDDGHVYAQNPPIWIAQYKTVEPAIKALAKDRANVEVHTAKFNDLGFDNNSLDAVTMALIYHDAALILPDRTAMNAQIYAALKPGGVLLITDHHARQGSGIETTDTMHRIDAALVRREVEAAGFTLEAQSDALHFASDDRSKIVFDPSVRGKTDRFVYRFRKAK